MSPRDLALLEHMLEYCESIEAAVSRFGNSVEVFCADKAYHDLVCFYLLQIGELAGLLSSELRSDSAEEMEWGQMKGMRNIVAHHYGSLNLTIVWNTVINDIPRLKAFCAGRLAVND